MSQRPESIVTVEINEAEDDEENTEPSKCVFSITQPKNGKNSNETSENKEEEEDILCSDTQCEEDKSLLNEVLQGKDLKTVPESEYKTLISQLTYYENDCVSNFDVDGVAQSKKIRNELNELYKQQNRQKTYKQFRVKINRKLKEAKDNVENIEESYKKSMASLKDRQSKEFSKLQEKNQEELDRFESEWQNSSKVRRYTRASPHLQEIRYLRMCYAKRGEVQNEKEAKEVEKKVEENDIAKRAKDMYAQFDSDKKVFIAKQKNAEDVMRRKHEGEINSLTNAYRDELDAAQLRVKNIENKIKGSNSETVSNRHYRTEKRCISRPTTPAKTRAVGMSECAMWSLTLPPLSSQQRPCSQIVTRRSTPTTFKRY